MSQASMGGSTVSAASGGKEESHHGGHGVFAARLRSLARASNSKNLQSVDFADVVTLQLSHRIADEVTSWNFLILVGMGLIMCVGAAVLVIRRFRSRSNDFTGSNDISVSPTNGDLLRVVPFGQSTRPVHGKANSAHMNMPQTIHHTLSVQRDPENYNGVLI